MKKEILALIPARGGSKGLPGKNIRKLNNIPLIAHTIMAAKGSKYISRIIVATDSEDIASVARDYGAETPFKRPQDISGDTSHAFEVYKYTIEWLEKNEAYKPDILCVLLCTTALRDTDDIDKCLEKMLITNCDWCFSVNEMEHHPYRGMVANGDRIRPLFDVPRKLLWANRQELPKILRFNGGVIAGKTEHIIRHNEYNIDNFDFKHTDVRCVEMPQERSFDIDTIDDFMFIERILKRES